MTNTLTISPELAERLDSPHSSVRNAALESLRRIIAAPVVERQADAELLVEFFEHGPMATINWFTPSSFESGATKVYIAPPSPVAVVLPDRMEYLESDGDETIATKDAWNACLDKVKEMNQ